MQRIKETWIKMFFFFSKEVFQCEFAGEKNNPWLHFFFSFFSFVTAILSFFFLDSSYYTRIRIRPTFRKKKKKKKKESQSGSMKRLSFSLSSYFNHFLLLTFFPSMFSFFFLFFTLHSFLAGIIRGGQCSIFQKLLAQNNKYFFVLGARKKSSLVEKRGRFKEWFKKKNFQFLIKLRIMHEAIFFSLFLSIKVSLWKN